MKNIAAITVLTLMLSACVSVPVPMPVRKPSARIDAPTTLPQRTATDQRGLEAVMGKDSAALIGMFGKPRLDAVEAYGRKLQFSGKQCVLDAYLYPEGKNRAEIVTYVDARRSDGAEVDRATCIAALQQR